MLVLVVFKQFIFNIFYFVALMCLCVCMFTCFICFY